MRRIRRGVCLLIAVVFLVSFACPGLANIARNRQAVFRLPAELRLIGESAFEGTQAEYVILADKVESIGSRAFSGMPNLLTIRIPASATFIASDTLSASDSVTVVGHSGSAADDFAKKQGLPFLDETQWALLPAEKKLPRLQTEIPLQPITNDTAAVSLLLMLAFFLACVLPMRPRERSEEIDIHYVFP